MLSVPKAITEGVFITNIGSDRKHHGYGVTPIRQLGEQRHARSDRAHATTQVAKCVAQLVQVASHADGNIFNGVGGYGQVEGNVDQCGWMKREGNRGVQSGIYPGTLLESLVSAV